MTQKLNLIVLGGSRAFGTAFEDCDYDYYGVFTEDLRTVTGLHPYRETYTWQSGEVDCQFHELKKFLTLALKGNPTILDTLFSPYLICEDQVGTALRTHRRDFLSQRVLRSYLGYAEEQLNRFDRGVRIHSKGGQITGKFLRHAVRLLSGGLHLALTGEFLVRVSPYQLSLIYAVEQLEPEAAIGLVREMTQKLETAAITNEKLPEVPNEAAVAELLWEVRTQWIAS